MGVSGGFTRLKMSIENLGCKFCAMIYSNDYDMFYGKSVHWLCVGDKKTGNPLLIYRKHTNNILTYAQQEEAKILIASLINTYWKTLKIKVTLQMYPHIHIIISEVTNEVIK